MFIIMETTRDNLMVIVKETTTTIELFLFPGPEGLSS